MKLNNVGVGILRLKETPRTLLEANAKLQS